MADGETISTFGYCGTATHRVLAISTFGYITEVPILGNYIYVTLNSDNRQLAVNTDDRQVGMVIDDRTISLWR